jgi:hypothetical protein
VVGQDLGGFGVRRPLDEGKRIGNEQCAESAGLAVGVDDEDRTAGFDLAHGVVGVGQAESDLARTDGRGDLLVPRQDLNSV